MKSRKKNFKSRKIFRNREKNFGIHKNISESRKIFFKIEKTVSDEIEKKIMELRKKKLKSRKIFRNREKYFRNKKNISESRKLFQNQEIFY